MLKQHFIRYINDSLQKNQSKPSISFFSDMTNTKSLDPNISNIQILMLLSTNVS